MEQSGQAPLTAVRWSRIPATPKGSFTKSYDKNESINKTRSFYTGASIFHSALRYGKFRI